jgi:hypothetical protein
LAQLAGELLEEILTAYERAGEQIPTPEGHAMWIAKQHDSDPFCEARKPSYRNPAFLVGTFFIAVLVSSVRIANMHRTGQNGMAVFGRHIPLMEGLRNRN